MTEPNDARSRADLVGGRYQLLNQLGQGGMGTAHRALDRLSGRVVTVKRLNVAEAASVLERLSRSDGRLALAQEFRLLASLRHPNIVSVLDYGFDEERRPFFCMDLQENAQTIVEAGRGAALLVRADLLVQLLRALVYLHRHAIIHRDIKPENVVVAGTQVKVLDFGLSVYRDLLGPEAAPLVGTLAYMAPELLRGERPSERSDLYAVGVLAYELFTGRTLLSGSEHAQMITSGEGAAWLLRRPSADLDPRLRPLIARLVASEVGERYGGASQVIDALAAALGQPFGAETVATRESLLQAAPFVGREPELQSLTVLLKTALGGRGATWLIGGESGVGKSRLLEEIRTRALVGGFTVARGQAVSDGGSPYHIWRDAVSALLLGADVNDQQAAVLRAIVPDIARLLGRDVAEPPPVDLAAAQSRLFLSVEALLRGRPAPILLVLEDLQWAGSESLALLGAVARIAADLPLVVLGSFRTDEAPRLREGVEAAHVLALGRLDADAIARLGRMMIGDVGAQPQVTAYLIRESEGIPLFVVEIVRALAESAGTLDAIGAGNLPEHLVSGGMRRALQRRLQHVPPASVGPLQTAAVIGREVDPALLRALHAELDVEAWMADCAGAAVIERREAAGRFAHDKLREQVLEDLSAGARSALHRRVAEAIEAVHAGDSDWFTALAHHWRSAGDMARELRYTERSAGQALTSGAYQEAIVRFRRALELLAVAAPDETAPASRAGRARGTAWRRLINPLAGVSRDDHAIRHAMIEAGLTEAFYRLGDLRSCEQHGARALAVFELPTPTNGLGWGVGTLREAMTRAAQRMAGTRLAVAAPPELVEAIGRVQAQLIEVYFYSMRALPALWSTLRLLNLAEPSGPSPDLSRAYTILAVMSGMASLPRLAAGWSRRAVEIAEGTTAPGAVPYALNRATAVELAHCWWDKAESHIRRSDAIASEIGDTRLCEEARTESGILALYHGPLRPGLAPLQSAFELSRRSGSKQGACWSLLGQGDLLLRLGRADEAVPLYEDAIARLDEQAMRTEAIWGNGGLALCWLRLGDPGRALELARRVLEHQRAGAPMAYWTQQGVAATAEVLLTLLEQRHGGAAGSRALAADAGLACAAMRRFARRFPLGRGHAPLWSGLQAWLSGRPRRAMRAWRRAIAAADALGLPYEEARAHLEIGRHLPAADPRRQPHFERAGALFEPLGCAEMVARGDAERRADGHTAGGTG